MGREGETLVFAPVAEARFTVDLNGAGTTATDAATVDQFGLAVVEVDALIEKRAA